jgi:hypothetical protein
MGLGRGRRTQAKQADRKIRSMGLQTPCVGVRRFLIEGLPIEGQVRFSLFWEAFFQVDSSKQN